MSQRKGMPLRGKQLAEMTKRAACGEMVIVDWVSTWKDGVPYWLEIVDGETVVVLRDKLPLVHSEFPW